ncbi:MAG: hypothetical protein PHU72_10285 [Dethiosulfovibrio sp.]|nr:hypothetical protein [Dethiosulfovibrio sp.]
MPVSGDVVTLSFSLAINNTPAGFWGNFIQAMNDNQGAITAIVGMLTVSVLVFQLWIMCRQAKISKEQARISTESNQLTKCALEISNKANELHLETSKFNIKEKILWNLIKNTKSLVEILMIVKGISECKFSSDLEAKLNEVNIKFTNNIDTLRSVTEGSSQTNYTELWSKFDKTVTNQQEEWGLTELTTISATISNLNNDTERIQELDKLIGKIKKIKEIFIYNFYNNKS